MDKDVVLDENYDEDISDTLEAAVITAQKICGIRDLDDNSPLPENNLDDNIREYYACKCYKEAYEKKMAELRDSILEDMGGEDEYSTPEGINVKAVVKETFKYTDEIGMIKWCEDNGYTQFITKKINTTPMNKELKKGQTLTESLKPLYTKQTSVTLTVNK